MQLSYLTGGGGEMVNPLPPLKDVTSKFSYEIRLKLNDYFDLS